MSIGEKAPFPPWLRELCYFGGIIVTITVFTVSGQQSDKSNQRSTSEKLDRVIADVASFSGRLTAIEARLPNKEAEDLKYKIVADKIDTLRGDFELEKEKTTKYKADLLKDLVKKGIVE